VIVPRLTRHSRLGDQRLDSPASLSLTVSNLRLG
jgi:hypothetical protein